MAMAASFAQPRRPMTRERLVGLVFEARAALAGLPVASSAEPTARAIAGELEEIQRRLTYVREQDVQWAPVLRHLAEAACGFRGVEERLAEAASIAERLVAKEGQA
jgi:hypothetical protein